MASLRGVRDQVRELRAEIAPGRPQRLIAVSTAVEADAVQGRLGAGEDALIVITGVPRLTSRSMSPPAGAHQHLSTSG